MPTYDLPKTPQSAPPNFYAQAGQMASGGAPGGDPNAKGKKAPGDGDKDREFLNMVTKLLSALEKLGDLKPQGQDVSQFTKAMADTAKDMLKQVFRGDAGAADKGGAAGDSSGDLGDASAAAPGGMGAAASPDTGAS